MATCAPLARVPAKSASFPEGTHRCHSVRDSLSPASFFQDVLVASEKIARLVQLLSFFSASLPMKPMRVILLRYIRFSFSALLSRAPGSEWARLPRQVAAFLGGPETGEPEPEWCRRQSRSCAGAGRRKSPEAVPRRESRTGNVPEMDHGSVAAAEEAAHSKIVDSQSLSVWKATTWFEVTHDVDRENERRRPPRQKRPPRWHIRPRSNSAMRAVKGVSESARWQFSESQPARCRVTRWVLAQVILPFLERHTSTQKPPSLFVRNYGWSRWVVAQEISGRHDEIGSSYEPNILFVPIWFRLEC